MRAITIQSQNKNKNIKCKQKTILMHTEILKHKLGRELKLHQETDHINNNGLDNRKCNLREVDRSQNMMNAKKQKEHQYIKVSLGKKQTKNGVRILLLITNKII